MSFQSFKSFVKIQLGNERQLQPSNNEGNNNEKVQEVHQLSLQAKQQSENQEKTLKRNKKPGTLCTFIAKIYSMLQQQQIQSIVRWSTHTPVRSMKSLQSQQSNSFQILDLQKFEQIVLPKYFKHSNMSSFVRQLNMYGFHKMRGDKGSYEFYHEKFQRGRKDLLGEIRRKSPEFVGLSQTNLPQSQFIKNLSSNNGIPYSSKIINFTPSMPLLHNNQLPIKQQQLDNQIFPSQSFLQSKKIIQQINFPSENSIQKEKQRKKQFIEEQNQKLKKIKQGKINRIKQLNSINRQEIELKFTKLMACLIKEKIVRENVFGGKKASYDQDESNSLQQNNVVMNGMIEHLMSNDLSLKFVQYQKLSSSIFASQKTQIIE